MAEHGVLLIVALVLDWIIGDPKWVWSKIPHPVALMGVAISKLEREFNNLKLPPAILLRRGSLVSVALIIGALLLGIWTDFLFAKLGQFGYLPEVVLVFVFLAQNSLYRHVGDVVEGLKQDGIAGGRKAVGLIVGRDPQFLDREGVSRAAIESLAENFSDGVVAPAFWYLVFGLPGLFVYKLINTADSMMGYKNERYLHFGRAAAKVDDLANWLPAKISVGAILVATFIIFGLRRVREAGAIVLRDAGLHNSPNAGWPEAAMAGAADFALGGPRYYEGRKTSQAFINVAGKHDLQAGDIETAMHIYSHACFTIWGFTLIAIVLSIGH